MTIPHPILIAESEVVSILDLGEAIREVQRGLAEQAVGEAVSMANAQARSAGSSLHATGAIIGSARYAGTKSWVHTRSGRAMPTVLLWAADGQLLAVIEAFALGQYRTASVTGVATDQLAAADATDLAICGTGAQALMQVAAIKAVRDIRTVRVWSPRAESRHRCRDAIATALDVTVTEVDSADSAVSGAAVVTLVTRATEPFLSAASIERGCHINAIGAIGLDRAEFASDLLDRADVVVVDDIGTAQAHSRELRAFYGTEPSGWGPVTTLADVVAEGTRWPSPTGVSLFKAMGLGLADIVLAAYVYEAAVENSLGQPLPSPARSRPRLRTTYRSPAAHLS